MPSKSDAEFQDAFLHPKARQLASDLLLAASAEKDQRLKTLLCLSSEKIDQLNRERGEIIRLLVALVKSLNGEARIPAAVLEKVGAADELISSADEGPDVITLRVKGSGGLFLARS
jgi:hypothetical protein